jgi:hypothetical protein
MQSLRPTPAKPPLTFALANVVERATKRAIDGQRIFSPIATLWDEYLESEAVRALPQGLRPPLLRLCKDISTLATRHFDAYIKGSSLPRLTDTPPANTTPEVIPPPPPAAASAPALTSNTPPQPRTYAQAATDPSSQPLSSRMRYLERTRPVHSPRPETRLFVRVGTLHRMRQYGSYAILQSLKGVLGTDAPVLKEIQATKTGFALCTDSLTDLETLEKQSDRLASAIQDCKIERQTKWTTYRIDNIPRTIQTLEGLRAVDSTILFQEIKEATQQAPVQIVQTTQSTQNNLPNSCWLASFESESHTRLDKTLRILGTRAIAIPIVRKPKIIQCIRCYQWHNARICTRTERCRICGSNNHTESGHKPCIPSTFFTNHTCPPRCLHCGGPHPADDRNCPLRPTHKGLKPQPERLANQSTMKAARKRAVVSAGCKADTQTSSKSPTTPTTPTRARSPSIPASIPSTRFRPGSSNRFAPLTGLTDRLQAVRENN